MLDVNFIRENQDLVKKGAENKGFNPKVIDEVLRLDEKRRLLIQEVEEIRAERNQVNEKLKGGRDQKLIDKSIELKGKLKDIEPELKRKEEDFYNLMLQVPNVAADDVPVGKDERGNKVVRKEGDKKQFSFKPKEHFELAEDLDLYDAKRAVRIAGTRSYFLKNELVMLEQAVLKFALDLISNEGFTPMTVPWMVNKEALIGTGYFPWGEEDHYQTQDGQRLIGTAEVSLTAYHKDELLSYKDLPIKLCGISPCFRREVGSYGKDTKGFFRLHQFNKVEMVVLSEADEKDSVEWHEKMLGFSEKLLGELELPYQVVLMCTGDMGAGQRKKYDIETWFPGQDKYRETHSDSYFLDFQARRLNMRYKDKDGETKYVYTLNNTVAATPRLLAAILENHQQKDGSISIPQGLHKYLGFTNITRT
jgi:seryl-tRNA synthetase